MIAEFEKILGCSIYEHHFGEHMKKAGVAILVLAENDLKALKKLSPRLSHCQTLFEMAGTQK